MTNTSPLDPVLGVGDGNNYIRIPVTRTLYNSNHPLTRTFFYFPWKFRKFELSGVDCKIEPCIALDNIDLNQMRHRYVSSVLQNDWNYPLDFSLRSWRYCVGARLKFWRRSRVPKEGSREEAIEIFSRLRLSWRLRLESHSTILQRFSLQISLDYYTIPPATQATLDRSQRGCYIRLSLSNKTVSNRSISVKR